MRSGDRACRTGRDATVARSAAIRDRFIRRQFKRGQNFREKKPSSEPLIDKHRAFAVPANASFRSMVPFQHRSGIDITFLLSAKAAKKLVNLAELVCNYVVIILAARVPSNFSSSHVPMQRPPLEIIQRQNNNRPR